MKIRKSASENVIWGGEIPKRCDNCGDMILDGFWDGRFPSGVWGIACPDCRVKLGIVKGIGRGQQFCKLTDGKFHKIP